MALEALRAVRRAGVTPTVHQCNKAISACGKSGEWRAALDLLAQMRGIHGADPNGPCAGCVVL